MTGRVVLVLLALAAIAPRAPVPRAQEREEERPGRGALAILRRDGLLFPFASFDRDLWNVTWPVDIDRLKIPPAFSTVPPKWWGTRTPDRWRVRLTTGEDRVIEARNPQTFSVFCERRLGVRTTYEPSLPVPIGVDPFPKDGLAITGSVPIEPIEIVNLAAPEAAFLASALIKEFNRVEDQTLNNVARNTRWNHPIDSEDRHKLPIRLESWYRSPIDPSWTVSYIEAVRQYPPGPQDKGCGLETLVSGWVFHENGALKSRMILGAKTTYCDRVGATYMLPLGLVRPKERPYWVFQLSGWDDEWYDVAAVGRQNVQFVVEVQARGATGCPRR
jgi:hypothetical protein